MYKSLIVIVFSASQVFAQSSQPTTAPTSQSANVELPPVVKKAQASFQAALTKADQDYDKALQHSAVVRAHASDSAIDNYVRVIDIQTGLEKGKKNSEAIILSLEAEKERVAAIRAAATQPAKITDDRNAPEATKIVDLLKDLDIKRDTIRGDWSVTNGNLIVKGDGATPACLRFHNQVPAASYQLQAEFTKPEGGDALGIYLPVNSAMVMVVIRSQQIGLDTLNGKRFDVNETTRGGDFGDTKLRKLIVDVSSHGNDVQIEVSVDGKQYIDWTGSASSFKLNDDWAIGGSNSFAVGSWNTSFVIHSLQFQNGPPGK